MIVCDWNGTLFRDVMEEAYFVALCRRLYFRALLGGRIATAARQSVAGLRCCLAYVGARLRPGRRLEYVRRILESLNGPFLSGLPLADVEQYTRHYARRIQPRLDGRLIGPLRAVRERTRVRLGVVSSGCRIGIQAALELAELSPDFILANEFCTDGQTVSGFDFALADNKWEVLTAFLDLHGVDPGEVMYVGDSRQDQQCLHNVGLPVVSFWATAEAKRELARTCDAFVPADQSDFERHLAEAVVVAGGECGRSITEAQRDQRG